MKVKTHNQHNVDRIELAAAAHHLSVCRRRTSLCDWLRRLNGACVCVCVWASEIAASIRIAVYKGCDAACCVHTRVIYGKRFAQLRSVVGMNGVGGTSTTTQTTTIKDKYGRDVVVVVVACCVVTSRVTHGGKSTCTMLVLTHTFGVAVCGGRFDVVQFALHRSVVFSVRFVCVLLFAFACVRV